MTLIETLVSLGIFLMIFVAVVGYQVSIFSNQRAVAGSFDTALNAQVILKTMLKELRESAPAMNGSYTIASAGTSSISFFSDPDNDGQTEQITYSLIGKTLYRAVIQPSGSPAVYNPATQATSSILYDVLNGTSTPVFQYYDQNYTGTSSPLSLPISISSVRLIDISLSIGSTQNILQAPRTYTTQVSLRNLKTNL